MACPLAFEATFAAELGELSVPGHGARVLAPRLLALNEDLAVELGADPEALRAADGVALLAGAATPVGATPVAQAYAGHQFGGLSPQLGDGRALLLGEVIDVHGRRRDVHLKGSGPTPFARRGDGLAAVGPMLREWVVGEAMHALGIPTTRALAVVATGETVRREVPLPGAVLARVAASHLRIGTFEWVMLRRDPALLQRLTDYAVTRHHPSAEGALGLLAAVAEAQAALVAQWLGVGFVHGVMNTDNVAISGETIDYGPCAFLDRYDPEAVFSSIDHGGRYAFGRQPGIAHWNLARLAEAILPLIDPDVETAVAAATDVLDSFPERFAAHRGAVLRAKLGLLDERPGDEALADELLAVMHADRLDFTGTFRALAGAALPAPLWAWGEGWRARLAAEGRDPRAVAADLAGVNPAYVPRNHLLEEALVAATAGDLGPVERLVAVVRTPYTERPGLERYTEPAPDAFAAGFRTFCGT